MAVRRMCYRARTGVRVGAWASLDEAEAPHTPHSEPSFLPRLALVMPFSREALLGPSMTLTPLSGAKSLRDPFVSQLLGDRVASSPPAEARW